MTEDEAKQKLCHKTIGPHGAPAQRCAASECMAWGWITPTPVKMSKKDKTERNGYCAVV